MVSGRLTCVTEGTVIVCSPLPGMSNATVSVAPAVPAVQTSTTALVLDACTASWNEQRPSPGASVVVFTVMTAPSHCSPASTSNTPSSQVEGRAVKRLLGTNPRALTVPLTVSQVGSISATSFTLPASPAQEDHFAFTRVPRAFAATLPVVGPQTAPRETCLPLITKACGAESPGSTGAPATR